MAIEQESIPTTMVDVNQPPLPTREGLISLWEELQSQQEFERAITRGASIRGDLVPHGEVVLRKTFGLNEPGCTVNCAYCTLGVQYVGTANRNLLRSNLEDEVLREAASLPDGTVVELVGYWVGINKDEGSTFETLVHLIQNLSPRIVGADLGIINNSQVMIGLRQADLTYIHNNLETSPRLYPTRIGISDRRFDLKIQTLKLAEEVGLQTTSGILLGVGEEAADLAELCGVMRILPIRRIAVNFMDYQTDQRISERYQDVRGQLTPDYALRVLIFLRLGIRPDQSLMVGSGVGAYLYSQDVLASALNVVDTLHIGSFINLQNGGQGFNLVHRLDVLKYRIVPSPYFADSQ